ncbi:MAG: pre-peptidase C-terminal domain-containing protein, partial [Thermoguttaceae bacterium]
YSFTLAAGQPATVAAASASGLTMQLFDSGQNLLGQGQTAANLSQEIGSFVAPAAGVYYVRLSGATAPYNLLVTRGVGFDTEPNDTLATAQSLSGTGGALGYLASTSDPGDYYRIALMAGDALTLSTQTPSDGPFQFPNTLDPKLELYDPAGNLVANDDNGAPDGRNALLNYTATAGGSYVVRVAAAAQAGEYLLGVQGATGPLPDFAVASTTPPGGGWINAATKTFAVVFSDPVLVTSVQTADLLIDGAADASATPPSFSDNKTVVFTLPALADGTHAFTLAAGSIKDLQGAPLDAYSGTFTVDTTGPRVTASSIAEGNVLPAGNLLYTATFGEDMDTSVLSATDFTLVGTLTGAHAATSFAWSDPRNVRLQFANLSADTYTLTLKSGAGEFQDLAGNALDGEPHSPYSLPSGDGVPGGDFFVHFTASPSLVSLDLLPVLTPTTETGGPPDTIATLPSPITTVPVGSTYYVEAWVQDTGTPLTGISGGYFNLAYQSSLADPTSLAHGSIYTALPSGTVDQAAGQVIDFGGSALGAGTPGIGDWALLGRITVVSTGAGAVTFTPQQASDEFSRFSAGAVPWSEVNAAAVTVQQQPYADQPNVRLVVTDTSTAALTQTTLPAQAELDIVEDHPFYGEVWVQSNVTTKATIGGGSVNLNFNPAYGQILSVDPVNANWTGGSNGVIDNAAGTLTGLTRTSSSPATGVGNWVLFARVQFSGIGPVDKVSHAFGPYDAGLTITQDTFSASGTPIGGTVVADVARIYPVIYDVDNTGRITGGDFGVFAAAYRGTVGSPEDPVTGPFYTWADFDGNGRVTGGDFGYFAAVYRQYDSQIDFSELPPRYRPANWVSGASVRNSIGGSIVVSTAAPAAADDEDAPPLSALAAMLTSPSTVPAAAAPAATPESSTQVSSSSISVTSPASPSSSLVSPS